MKFSNKNCSVAEPLSLESLTAAYERIIKDLVVREGRVLIKPPVFGPISQADYSVLVEMGVIDSEGRER